MPVWWLLVPTGWQRASILMLPQAPHAEQLAQAVSVAVTGWKCSLAPHPQQQNADWRNKLGRQAQPGVGTHRCAHSAA